MAEKTTKVTVTLPRNEGYNAEQDEFFSLNFKNYRIQRGKRVEIPEGLAEIIENNDRSIEAGLEYSDELVRRQNEVKTP